VEKTILGIGICFNSRFDRALLSPEGPVMRMARGSEIIIAVILFFMCVLSQRGESAVIEADTSEDTLSCESCEAFIDSLDEKASSTLKTKMSLPIGFYGEGRLKIQYHDMQESPPFMRYDRSWLQSGWEGNEGLLRLGMFVNIGSNVTLNSQIGFQNTLPGNYINDPADTGKADSGQGFTPSLNRHDKSNDPAYIHDEMKADITVRTGVSSFTIRFGGLQWIEASPLTLWKSPSRLFAWDHLPFESEEPIATYYDKNVKKIERTGRSAWNKKPFYGLGLECKELPYGLYFNAFYGIYERYDSGEREFVDYSDDLDYTGNYGVSVEAKNRGISDSYHHVAHFRLAKANLFDNMTVGFNFMGYHVQKTLTNSKAFWKTFFGQDDPYNASPRDSAFYKEPKIASFDIKGAINKRLEMHADIAMSLIDTTKVYYNSNAYELKPLKNRLSPAVYGFFKSAYGIPASIDAAYISQGFYSPFSFAVPSDAFYPFGSNLVGQGKFIARAEASPYAQNMTGAVISVSPDIHFGNVKFSYGQHMQIRTARDIIFFPYRLNGPDLSSFFHSSYNRWGIDLLDVSIPGNGKYDKRLGDESFRRTSNLFPLGPDAGGIRHDCPGVFEGFVPYENKAQAEENRRNPTEDIFSHSASVPYHKKYTFNLEATGACNLNNLVGYQKDLSLSFYSAINGISTQATPIAFNQKKQLLWSIYVRLEPSIALSNKFYFLGLAGYENWKSDNAWMTDSTGSVIFCPIDFRDIAYGVGFDWEMFSNVGLHTRVKWMQHEDVKFKNNNWATPIISTEIKMVF
jgi:hypothetical protein